MASEVLVKILGDAKGLSASIGQAEAGLGRFAGAGKAAAAGLAAAGIAAGAALAKIGSQFDDASDSIRVGTGATGAALRGLEADFKAVIRDVPTDFAMAATAIADLNTRTGQTGDGLQSLAGQFLELSRITKTEVGANIASVTRLFGDWGVAATDQVGTLDKLFRASQATGIGVDQLAQQMVQFGAPLRQMGFGLDESIATLAKFEKEGVNSELVMGSMRIALGRLAKDGLEPVSAFREQVAAIKAMADTGQANLAAIELFGARAGPDMAAAIREGRFELGDLLATVSSGTDTIRQASKDTQDFSEKWTVLKNRVMVGLEPLASRVFDAMGDGLDHVMAIAPRVMASLSGVGSGLKQIGAALFAGKFVSGSLFEFEDDQTLGAFFRVRETAIEVFGKVRDAIATAFANARQFIEENRETFAEWGRRLVAVGGQVVDAIRSAWELIAQAFETWSGIVRTIWERWGDRIWAIAKSRLDALIAVISSAFEIVKGIFDVFTGVLSGDWSKAWDGIKAIVSGAWDGIKAIVSTLWTQVRELLGAGLEELGGFFRRTWDGLVDFFAGIPGRLKDAAGDMFGFLREAFRSAINWIIRGWNSLEFKVPGFDPPGPIGEIGGFSLGVPKIPLLAEGGRVTRAGVALVGEGGPELATLNMGAQVAPLDKVQVDIDYDRLAVAMANALEASRPAGRPGAVLNIFNPEPEPASRSLAAAARLSAADEAGW